MLPFCPRPPQPGGIAVVTVDAAVTTDSPTTSNNLLETVDADTTTAPCAANSALQIMCETPALEEYVITGGCVQHTSNSTCYGAPAPSPSPPPTDECVTRGAFGAWVMSQGSASGALVMSSAADEAEEEDAPSAKTKTASAGGGLVSVATGWKKAKQARWRSW